METSALIMAIVTMALVAVSTGYTVRAYHFPPAPRPRHNNVQQSAATEQLPAVKIEVALSEPDREILKQLPSDIARLVEEKIEQLAIGQKINELRTEVREQGNAQFVIQRSLPLGALAGDGVN